MQTLNAVEIAQMVTLSSDQSVIVLELVNGGSSSRWGQTFTSLTAEQLNALDEVAFLSFDSWREAVDTFERLTRDASENNAGRIISGTITLVARPFDEDDGVETHAWDLDDDSRPVFRNGLWSYEDVVERI